MNPEDEGRKIAREYISKLIWKIDENADNDFATAFEKWKTNTDVLRGIYEVLGHRRDLGFLGKRIVDRIKRMI